MKPCLRTRFRTRRNVQQRSRLTKPLKLVGEKGKGIDQYKEIEWDEAIDLFKKKFSMPSTTAAATQCSTRRFGQLLVFDRRIQHFHRLARRRHVDGRQHVLRRHRWWLDACIRQPQPARSAPNCKIRLHHRLGQQPGKLHDRLLRPFPGNDEQRWHAVHY